uniref:U5 small nuclear ribonucleoprotein TSSC4 n=1 Tax=Phallusia mammillata TaxID=59560 RepID=A0A6F9DV45_9ASCI|nr:protein TSSC4-like [Phallusia mammillata]
MADKSSYHLSSEDAEFTQRSKDIFGDIDKIKNSLSMNKEDIKPVGAKRKIPNAKSDSTSADKKPEKPAYETNPNKWTKYDLSDTETSNDRQNTQAAFAFLYDVQKRKKSEDSITDKATVSSDVDMTESVSFHKPAVRKMKEHVVGMSTGTKKKSIPKDVNTSFDKVELDHLENISAAEFQAEIASKLEENLLAKSTDNKSEGTGTFKHVSKQKRNMRTRKQSDEDE